MHARVRLDRPISDRELLGIGEQNPGWKVERVDGGVLMSPTTAHGAIENAKLTAMLVQWSEANGFVAFDSNAGFRLPNESHDVLSPDGAVLERETWLSLPDVERHGYAKVRLDAVIEIVSKSDNPLRVAAKCERWVRDGARYAVMLDAERGIARAWGTPPLGFPAPDVLLAGIAA